MGVIISPSSSQGAPPWLSAAAWLVVSLYVPILLVLNYTLYTVYPVFAIIGDDTSSPAHDEPSVPSPHCKEAEALGEKGVDAAVFHGDEDREEPPVDTSSIRSIYRLLRFHGGFAANFRGLAFYLASYASLILFIAFVCLVFGAPVSTLPWLISHIWHTPLLTLTTPTSLATVQLSAAWVHIVISRPSSKPFWRRLPPFMTTLRATWKPVLLHWLANKIALKVPRWLAFRFKTWWFESDFVHVFGTHTEVTKTLTSIGSGDMSIMLKFVVICLVSLALHLTVVVPARVVLFRVQASLLPADEVAIVPFDRTFGGQVKPVREGEQAYASISDALGTFTGAAWRRLMVITGKIYAVCLVSVLIYGLVLFPALSTLS